MNKLALMAAMVAVAPALPLQAQTTQKLSASKANDYGLVYNLPLTSLKVTIEARCSDKKPGEFYRYAKKYLSVDPVMAPATTWELKSVVVTPEGVADPSESYLVQFKNGSTPFITVDANSFPVSVNDDEYQMPALPVLPEAQAPEPTILERPVAKQAMTQEMLQSQSSAKRAELAASKIYELRQSRNDIISGQADQMPGDGKAMQLALDNLSGQEEALTAMFIGTEQLSTEVESFDWLVDLGDNNSSRTVIARLSQTDGLVAPDDLSGEPIYLEVTVKTRGEMPVNEKGEAKRFPKGGLAYRIPGEANVSVVYQGKTIYTISVAVAQLGVVYGLEPSMFTDRKAPAYVHFNPTSGAIVELGTLQ